MKRIITATIAALSIQANATQLDILTYSSFNSDWGPAPKITAAFEEACDCTINWISAEDSVMMLRRLQLEGEALDADLIIGLDNQSIAEALDTGLIATLNTPISTRFGETKQAVPFDFGYLAFVTRKDATLPSFDSLNALASADNTFTIAVEDPRSSSVGASMLAWAESETTDAKTFWTNIKPKLSAVTGGWSEAYSLFTNGEVDMVLSYTTSPIYHQIVENDDQYTALIFDHPHYEQIEYAVALKQADEAALGEAFLRYLTAPAVQKEIALSNWMYPVVDNVPLPDTFNNAPRPQGINLAPKDVAQKMPSWLATWKSVLLAP
ncbi:thiamine ABC transporter substrate-binding protein [Suttonella sp. R2A3]|uniref:thiamine ABC transporter substrate-binding protein n=1 Tax=Suttonella sp. R2A3 TaxID=2908648 RepID=UPI001F31A1C3|nr:thiamine ABC transporter substrate-binding protein [Suttonella sp. R2A3]UJF24409.1 thiamine ABC transporter substrate-binding protein [Suttonella sp. R2A3]